MFPCLLTRREGKKGEVHYQYLEKNLKSTFLLIFLVLYYNVKVLLCQALDNSDTPVIQTMELVRMVIKSFQMCCTGGQITFLQSYLPEKKCPIFFFIKRNNLLIDVMKGITDHILKHEVVTEWHYE